MFAPAEVYGDKVKLPQMVSGAFEYAKRNRTKQEARWQANLKMYRMQHDLARFKNARSAYPYESALKLPTVFYHVEGPTTQVCLSLLSNNPMVSAKPMRAEAIESARRTEWLLHHQFDRDINIRERLAPWVRLSFICDSFPVRIGWKVQIRSKKVRKLNYDNGMYEDAGEEHAVYGFPTVEGRMPWDLFVDPWAPILDDEQGHGARFVIDRMVMTPEQLEEHVKTTEGTMDWDQAAVKKALDLRGTVNTTTHWRTQQLQQQKMRDGWSPSENDDRLIQVLDYWERDREVFCVGHESDPLVLTNGPQPNPYDHGMLPFAEFRVFPLEGFRDTLSLVDIIGDMAHEKDARRNQRMENIKRAVNFTRVYDKNRVDGALLGSRPAGDIPVTGSPADVMHFYSPPDVTQNAYQETGIIDNEIQLATGYGSPLTGLGGPSRETARGLGMRQQSAGSRYDFQVVTAFAPPLRRIARMVHALDRQYFADSEQRQGIIPIIGADGARAFSTYNYSDIDNDFEIEFTVDPTMAAPAMQLQGLTNWVGVLAQGAPQLLNWPEIAVVGFEKLGYRDDARRFLKGVDSKARKENEIWAKSAVFPPVTPDDNDDEHIGTHSMLVTEGTIRNIPPELQQQAKFALQAHFHDHDQSKQKKMLAAQNSLLQREGIAQ